MTMHYRTAYALFLIPILALLVSCGGADRDATRAGASLRSKEFSQVGTASWYGPGFHGRQTASGETYDQDALTAAHRTLPLGTRVAVTNVASGQSVTVEINDRGPYVDGRIIDLSRAAIERIGLKDQGTGVVRLETDSLPEGPAER